MKSITLHPASVLVGGALAWLCLALASAAQTPGSAAAIPVRSPLVLGHIPASWWVQVRLCTANPFVNYTVPGDSYLVLTYADPAASILVDGQPFVTAPLGNGSFDKNGTRIAIPPGSVLTTSNGCSVVLGGYLEPVR